MCSDVGSIYGTTFWIDYGSDMGSSNGLFGDSNNGNLEVHSQNNQLNKIVELYLIYLIF